MEIKTIGIIGARKPSSAIAAGTIIAGYRTILEDVSPEVLSAGVALIERVLDEAVGDGRLTAVQRDAALANLVVSRSVEDVCREADLLLDALPEELEVKLEIFTIFDKFAKPGAILATTSRETLVADLAGMTFRKEDCVGMQFLEPAFASPIMEIFRTRETSDATVASVLEIAGRMGKKTIVAFEREA